MVAYLGGFILFLEPSDQWTGVICSASSAPSSGCSATFGAHVNFLVAPWAIGAMGASDA
jgi:hypothetical protein